MKEIRILKGNFGYKPMGGYSIRVYSMGETVEVPEETAERLISEGIAEAVEQEEDFCEACMIHLPEEAEPEPEAKPKKRTGKKPKEPDLDTSSDVVLG